MREKLIRDKLVSEIDPSRIRTATDDEYQALLRHKLLEEADEVFKTQSKDELVEEIADVLTVLKALCESNNIVNEAFDKAQSKSLEKGEFQNKVVLNLE